MRKCVRCGSEMIPDCDIHVDVNTAGYAFGDGGGVVAGSGNGYLSVTREVWKNKGIFRHRIETLGNIKAAYCPSCAEISLYLSAE